MNVDKTIQIMFQLYNQEINQDFNKTNQEFNKINHNNNSLKIGLFRIINKLFLKLILLIYQKKNLFKIEEILMFQCNIKHKLKEMQLNIHNHY